VIRDAMIALLLGVGTAAAEAPAVEERSLTLYNTHTRQTVSVVFKRGEDYDADALAKLREITFDQRSGESHEMGPGGYAFIPPGTDWTLRNASDAAARFHWIRKAYERVEGIEAPTAFVTNETAVDGAEMPGTQGRWTTQRFVDPLDVRRKLRHRQSDRETDDTRIVVIDFHHEIGGFSVDRVLRVV
jgi:hypothetical protein